MLGVVLALVMAQAQGPASDRARAADAPGPSKGLLEYLATFQSVDGDWLDPELLPRDDDKDVIANEQTLTDPEPDVGRSDVIADDRDGDGR